MHHERETYPSTRDSREAWSMPGTLSFVLKINIILKGSTIILRKCDMDISALISNITPNMISELLIISTCSCQEAVEEVIVWEQFLATRPTKVWKWHTPWGRSRKRWNSARTPEAASADGVVAARLLEIWFAGTREEGLQQQLRERGAEML